MDGCDLAKNSKRFFLNDTGENNCGDNRYGITNRLVEYNNQSSVCQSHNSVILVDENIVIMKSFNSFSGYNSPTSTDTMA